jgi:hypothetical protein
MKSFMQTTQPKGSKKEIRREKEGKDDERLLCRES